MAEIIDEIEQPELQLEEGESAGDLTKDNYDDVALDGQEEQAEAVAEASNITVDPEPETDVPEKFRGKSAAEMAKAYTELENRMSEQGHELANLRSTLDAMALNTSKASEPEPEPLTEADFFTDPTTAVNRAIEQHPTLRQAQEMAQKMAYQQGVAMLQQRHPDLKEIVTSQGFKDWISSSSVRTARYEKADTMGDVEEADDLISTYKELTRVTRSAEEASKKAQKQAVKSANTGATRGNSDVRGSRRIYRSADIRELMRTNPNRYEDLQPEIMRAYAEGRVRD
jgi:hypothetical protein